MNCIDPSLPCTVGLDTTTVSLDASFDASLTSDISLFEANLEQAQATQEISSAGQQLAKAALEPLNNINAEAAELAEFATKAAAQADGMTPSQIVSLTVKSQEFMFHSQLTANIANRTADGIQQLFRQQG